MPETDYGEPWEMDGTDIVDRHGDVVSETLYCHDDEGRIIACVNACAGICDPEKVVAKWREVVRLHGLKMDDKTFGYAVRMRLDAKDE